MANVRIEVTENGPYKVEGPIDVVDHNGEPLTVPTGATAWLCRCGGSTKKPFCDGTHSKIGFKGAREAVEASQ